MNLAEFYVPGRLAISFELFPPKTPAGETALLEHVAALHKFAPAYVTCTYGAGGSTRDKTLDVVSSVKERFQTPVAAHLTCVDSTVEQLRSFLQDAKAREVDAIVALRGDPPKGKSKFQPTPGGLNYANELVALIRAEFPDFGVAVAGYPEKHREAASIEDDITNLLRKVDAGGDVVITQLFYQNADFFRFREQCQSRGITAPLIPGILPVTSLAQIQRISSLCAATLPAEFVARLGERDDADWQFQVGVEFAQQQVRELIDQGAPGLHFYVLNKSQAASAVLETVLPPATN